MRSKNWPAVTSWPWGTTGRRQVEYHTGVQCPICRDHQIVVCDGGEDHWVRCQWYERQGAICPSLEMPGPPERVVDHETARVYMRHCPQGEEPSHELMCQLVRLAYPEYSRYKLEQWRPRFH